MNGHDGLSGRYRRIDALLEARARDYPRRVEPTWSELLAAIDDVAERLREGLEPVGERLPGFYRRPLFVVGHRKTGTTLLQELLDGHPQLVDLPGESNHFLTFLPGRLLGASTRSQGQRAACGKLAASSQDLSYVHEFFHALDVEDAGSRNQCVHYFVVARNGAGVRGGRCPVIRREHILRK